MKKRYIFRRLFFILAATGMIASGLGTVFGRDAAAEVVVQDYFRQQIEAKEQKLYLEVDGTRYQGDIVVTDRREVLVCEQLWKQAFGAAVLE